jgi:hypothetical protein
VALPSVRVVEGDVGRRGVLVRDGIGGSIGKVMAPVALLVLLPLPLPPRAAAFLRAPATGFRGADFGMWFDTCGDTIVAA